MEKIMNVPFREIIRMEEFTVLRSHAGVADIALRDPMKLPFGTVASRPSGIVEITLQINGKEITGFGEGATLQKPVFTDDSGVTISSAISELSDELVGKKLTLEEASKIVSHHVFSDEKRFPTARMTVEMALIDAVAKAHGISVSTLLGVPDNIQEVPFGKSIGGGDKEKTINEAEIAINEGARKIKLKVTPQTVDTVVDVIKQLRKDHEDLELMVDANGSFDPSLDSDLDGIKKLDGLHLVMIEEPVSREGDIKGIEAVALLREKLPDIKTLLCLDDCLVDLPTTERALTEGLADAINIKPGRIGSILTAIELAKKCKSLGKQIMVGGMLEATPGRCMTTTLAALFCSMGFTIPGDLSLAQERLVSDLVEEEHYLRVGLNGGILLPKGIGWGF